MTTYAFIDGSNVVRLDGTLDPDPAGNSVPTGWEEDASNPANVDSNGGGLTGLPTPSAASDAATKGYADTALALKAPLASPTFTGTPAAPTAAGGTSTTQVATTAFVATSFALKASPTFTGTPLAPTAAKGTNTTQLATTAHVANILVSGAGAPTVFVAPLYYDTTAVTGGLYAWNGAAYVHVSAVV